jgi:hypothetical protein
VTKENEAPVRAAGHDYSLASRAGRPAMNRPVSAG